MAKVLGIFAFGLLCLMIGITWERNNSIEYIRLGIAAEAATQAAGSAAPIQPIAYTPTGACQATLNFGVVLMESPDVNGIIQGFYPPSQAVDVTGVSGRFARIIGPDPNQPQQWLESWVNTLAFTFTTGTCSVPEVTPFP